jgi:uncharacterized protein (DUF4415 family)
MWLLRIAASSRGVIDLATCNKRGIPTMQEVVKVKARRGRPPYERPVKQMVSLRMDIDVLEGLRSTGRGWQTRINAIMRDWLKTQPPEA